MRSRSAASAPGSRTNRIEASTPAERSAPARPAVIFSAPPTLPSQRTSATLISVHAPPGGHCDRCAQQQADVGPERPVRHVQLVELDHLLERDVGPAKHLPAAAQA